MHLSFLFGMSMMLQIERRLKELRPEYPTEQISFAELESKEAADGGTLLRLGGSTQSFEEEISKESNKQNRLKGQIG